MSEKNGNSEIIILRSNDGAKIKLANVSQSMSLLGLKRLIAKSHLSVSTKYQRLFFMGRELKTESRSLESLGFGKFGIRVLHLMSNQPKELDLTVNEISRKRPASTVPAGRKISRDDVVVLDDSPAAAVVRNRARASNDVIELINDEGSENASSTKTQRQVVIDLS